MTNILSVHCTYIKYVDKAMINRNHIELNQMTKCIFKQVQALKNSCASSKKVSILRRLACS